MISRGTVITLVVLVALGWSLNSAVQTSGKRYERLKEAFPGAFCEDAAKVVDGGFMHEEQYYAYGCSVRVLVDQRGAATSRQAYELSRSLLESNSEMTEPECWDQAIKYLTEALPLHEYYSLDCDLTRIPSDDVFESWLSQR